MSEQRAGIGLMLSQAGSTLAHGTGAILFCCCALQPANQQVIERSVWAQTRKKAPTAKKHPELPQRVFLLLVRDVLFFCCWSGSVFFFLLFVHFYFVVGIFLLLVRGWGGGVLNKKSNPPAHEQPKTLSRINSKRKTHPCTNGKQQNPPPSRTNNKKHNKTSTAELPSGPLACVVMGGYLEDVTNCEGGGDPAYRDVRRALSLQKQSQHHFFP